MPKKSFFLPDIYKIAEEKILNSHISALEPQIKKIKSLSPIKS
jgi:hypothetical protein